MTTTAAHSPPHNRDRLALLGALWALLFAGLHLYWAAGGRVGVPAGAADIAGRPAFLAYDLIAAGVFLGAAAIAALLGLGLGRARLHRRLRQVTRIGAVVALLRGGVGLVQDAVLLRGGSVPAGLAYDLWFTVAGVLFWVVVRPAAR